MSIYFKIGLACKVTYRTVSRLFEIEAGWSIIGSLNHLQTDSYLYSCHLGTVRSVRFFNHFDKKMVKSRPCFFAQEEEKCYKILEFIYMYPLKFDKISQTVVYYILTKISMYKS